MSRNIDISGIKNFRERLQKLQNVSNTDIAMAIANHGANLLEGEISSASIPVKSEEIGNGKAKIVAEGSQIAYIEFGTGVRGRGTYKGELPTQNISFESRNQEWTVPGWTYNYFATFIRGEKDYQGFEAKAPVWRTAEKLQHGEAAKAIENFLDEKGV